MACPLLWAAIISTIEDLNLASITQHLNADIQQLSNLLYALTFPFSIVKFQLTNSPFPSCLRVRNLVAPPGESR